MCITLESEMSDQALAAISVAARTQNPLTAVGVCSEGLTSGVCANNKGRLQLIPPPLSYIRQHSTLLTQSAEGRSSSLSLKLQEKRWLLWG